MHNANPNNVVKTTYNTCASSFSWSAIFSGLFTSTAIGALFSLLGIAIGLALFKPDTDVISTLSTGAVIWFIVGGTAAMFIGGLITGYLTPSTLSCKAGIHGLVMWSFSFILGLMLTGSGTGTLLTGSGQLISNTITMSGKVASSAIKPIASQVADSLNLTENKSLTNISKQVTDLVSKASKKAAATAKQQGKKVLTQSADESQEQLMESIKNFVTNTNDQVAQQAHDTAVQQLMENADLNRAEAEQLLTKWQTTYQQTVEKVQQKANELKERAKDTVNYTSNVLSVVTFSAFIAMVLGALAAIYGSMLGVRWHKD